MNRFVSSGGFLSPKATLHYVVQTVLYIYISHVMRAHLAQVGVEALLTTVPEPHNGIRLAHGTLCLVFH